MPGPGEQFEREARGEPPGGGDASSSGLDLATIFDAIDIPTAILDADGNVVVWNESGAELVGVDRSAVTGLDGPIGEQLYDDGRRTILAERVLAHPEDAHEVYDEVRLAEGEYSMLVGGDGPVYEDESTVDASGADIWFIATPVYDDAGDLVGAIEFTQDRTESERRTTEVDALVEEVSATLEAYGEGDFGARASFEDEDTIVEPELASIPERVNELGYQLQYAEELEASNERLQQFAYIASHDLQEPLRMVSSYLELLADEYEGELDAEADEYIGFATDGAARMQAMIDGLLTYSRVETRADPFEPVDATDVLEETLRSLELLVEDADATVEREPLPTVAADRNQLGQLFQNLIENAIEHAGDGAPTIRVTGEERDDCYHVAVADDGVGIPPDQQDRIFDIFEQGSRDGTGTGIGLAVCDRIVSRHGGELWVESEPGEGATFHVELPTRPGASSGADGGGRDPGSGAADGGGS